ncbi:MAG: response regulator transcription factor [Bacteriovoracaceae bacterium]
MKRIIIIDDEIDLFPLIKIKFKKEINKKEIKINFFDSALEALSFYKENPEVEFELIISEVTMPDYSGLTLFDDIKNINADQKFYICGAENDIVEARWVLGEKVNGYITKPLDFSYLAELFLGRIF